MVPIETLILRSLVLSTLLAIFLGTLATWAWVIGRTWEGGDLPRPSPIVERRRTPWARAPSC